MTQTGDDKELVLGNKQLISLFFVVVALCGVFFAMGYMIGTNSGKSTLSGDGSGSGTVPGDSGGPRPSPRQQAEPPRETADAARPTLSDSPAAPPLDTKPVDTKPVDTKPVDTKPAQDTPAPQPYDAKAVSSPEAGASYLQVTALPRADADGVVKTLRDQKFPTILATSSKDGLFRVLVGPYHQMSDVADAKSRLKTIGFGSAFVQKQ